MSQKGGGFDAIPNFRLFQSWDSRKGGGGVICYDPIPNLKINFFKFFFRYFGWNPFVKKVKGLREVFNYMFYPETKIIQTFLRPMSQLQQGGGLTEFKLSLSWISQLGRGEGGGSKVWDMFPNSQIFFLKSPLSFKNSLIRLFCFVIKYLWSVFMILPCLLFFSIKSL